MNYSKIMFKKVDLDTAAACFILAKHSNAPLIQVRDSASIEDLCDPKVLCIECGGSGDVEHSNFDHHGDDAPDICAAYQAWIYTGSADYLSKLVRYTQEVDLGGWNGPNPSDGKVSLSNLFSGMLMTTKSPVDKLNKGMELISKVLKSELSPDALGDLVSKDKELEVYATIKEKMAKQLEEELCKAQTFYAGELKIMGLQSSLPGVHGLLKRNGADVSVASNAQGYTTISVNPGSQIILANVLQKLNALEPGWGGHPMGTIIGSRAEGTSMSFADIANLFVQGS